MSSPFSGKGVDLILDCVGASYYEKNVKSVRVEGRWVVYGLLGKYKLELSLKTFKYPYNITLCLRAHNCRIKHDPRLYEKHLHLILSRRRKFYCSSFTNFLTQTK